MIKRRWIFVTVFCAGAIASGLFLYTIPKVTDVNVLLFVVSVACIMCGSMGIGFYAGWGKAMPFDNLKNGTYYVRRKFPQGEVIELATYGLREEEESRHDGISFPP